MQGLVSVILAVYSRYGAEAIRVVGHEIRPNVWLLTKDEVVSHWQDFVNEQSNRGKILVRWVTHVSTGTVTVEVADKPKQQEEPVKTFSNIKTKRR